ncbi:hypothetical protein JL107_14025 [Nakamurella flavida]|uniref:Uncharacterized protein n=1 Tax=Nakamurella flavida TaxID=363630 RepID=A0A938YLV5_9ACTN|nr:hypothetical protein [Nakamurella flavida]MBM9477564.1 hypothetical protein [Nakamurella flavida]MDP9779112.1 hypothetical protein [Nakamurella flavida]
MIEVLVMSCLAGTGAPTGRIDLGDARAAELAALTARTGTPVHPVGPRPGKDIDPLLRGRVLVVGDDADLAAVALRVLRRNLLGSVELAYAPARPTALTRLWNLPVGPDAVRTAATAPAHPVPLVRDDVGGVLLAEGSLTPLLGATYVDEHKVLAGPALRLQVRPDRARGLLVTVERRGALPWTRRRTTTAGRAVQIGSAAPSLVTSDGVEHPRRMDRWTFYRHTEDLLLVGADPAAPAGPAAR